MANPNMTHAELNPSKDTIFQHHSHAQMWSDLTISKLNDLTIRFRIPSSCNMRLPSVEEMIYYRPYGLWTGFNPQILQYGVRFPSQLLERTIKLLRSWPMPVGPQLLHTHQLLYSTLSTTKNPTEHYSHQIVLFHRRIKTLSHQKLHCPRTAQT